MGICRGFYYLMGWKYHGEAEEKARLKKIYDDFEEKPIIASGYTIHGQPKSWADVCKHGRN